MTTKVPAELSSTPSIVDNGDATAITIDSSERVIVGQTAIATGFENFAQLETSHASAGGLVINTQTASTSNYGRLIFTKGNASGNEGLIRYNTGDYHMSFWTAATQRLRLDSDGLKFGTDTAAANALDDYEEGTWTPAISTGGVTYTIQSGKYTKIGNVVTASFHIDINTNSNASGTTFAITGLPFTSSLSPSSIYWSSSTVHCNTWSNSSIPDNGLVSGGTTTLSLWILNGTSATQPTHGSLGGGNILATITYHTDA